jgi:hypothetical protein
MKQKTRAKPTTATVKPSAKTRLTLHPLNPETALRAAMQTGVPPKNKQSAGKQKQKT